MDVQWLALEACGAWSARIAAAKAVIPFERCMSPRVPAPFSCPQEDACASGLLKSELSLYITCCLLYLYMPARYKATRGKKCSRNHS